MNLASGICATSGDVRILIEVTRVLDNIFLEEFDVSDSEILVEIARIHGNFLYPHPLEELRSMLVDQFFEDEFHVNDFFDTSKSGILIEIARVDRDFLPH